MEEDEDREQLEPSCQHIKHKDILGEVAEEAVVACRSYHGKAGTDVIKSRKYCGKCRHQVVSVKGKKEHGSHEHGEESDEIYVDGTYYIVLYGPAVYRDLADYLGVDIGSEFLSYGLKEDHKAGYLDSASRASCAGSDGHQEDQGQFAERRPCVEVGGTVSRGGYEGCHLEE